VVLRWAVQQGIGVIPKSASPERQRANLDIFGFCLADTEMNALAGMDLGEDAAVDSEQRVEF
jgi:2,5-diketo-D-gluconate reductase A